MNEVLNPQFWSHQSAFPSAAVNKTRVWTTALQRQNI